MTPGVYTREDEARDRAQARIAAALQRLARPHYRAISDPRDTSIDKR